MTLIKKYLLPKTLLFTFLLSMGLTFVIEILSHRSLFGAMGAILASPWLFLLGSLIVCLTLSISGMFKHRSFFLALIGTTWLGLGIANCVMMIIRNSPLTGVDFYILTTGLTIITVYLSIPQIVLIACAILAALFGLFVLYRKLPTFAIPRLSGVIHTGLTFGAMLVLALVVQGARLVPSQFASMSEAYAKYGFPYCFTQTIIDRGIDQPKGYTDAGVEAIVDLLAKEHGQDQMPWERPNIIILQLESFFDITAHEGIELSEDPIPYFRELKETYPSGLLSVPSIGGGTANTEFEVLSGMTLDYFGIGEYPYNTICRLQPVPTLAHSLRDLGYSTAAFHNHEGSFYDRNAVYPALGFESFTSIEYMNGYERNDLGWCKDAIFETELLDAMCQTDGRDLLFAVSVQCHGKYPDEYEGGKITVSGIDDPVLAAQYGYYVNQLREVDAFLRDLTAALENLDEPTLLIVYGDHLPSLALAESDLVEGQSLYQTEYVVWSNTLSLPRERVDLDASQLTAHALSYAGIRVGAIMTLHQTMSDNDAYGSWLHTLQYDAVYGEGISVPGELSMTEMTMGRKEIVITNVIEEDGGIRIEGSGFSAHSVVEVNGWNQETIVQSPTSLFVQGANIKTGDKITVCQVSDSGDTLSRTEIWLYADDET